MRSFLSVKLRLLAVASVRTINHLKEFCDLADFQPASYPLDFDDFYKYCLFDPFFFVSTLEKGSN